MYVLKFGGSSLADAGRFAQVVDIISGTHDQHPTAVVVSAPQGITNKLVTLISAIENNTTQGILDDIKQHLQAILNDTLVRYPAIDKAQCQSKCELLFSDISRWIEGASLLGHCPEQTYAQIVASGERFSVLLLEAVFLSQSKSVSLLEPTEFIHVKTDTSEPIAEIDLSRAAFAELYQDLASLCFMPGFIAHDMNGNATTLGRNGSDYSAAILAACTNADVCEVWTDVDGVYNSDPRLIPDAKLLSTMSYNEAMELSYFGAKILHPKTISPLHRFNIPCRIKNTHAPENPGTYISDRSDSDDLIRAVTNLPNVAMIRVSGPEMKGIVGMASRVFHTISQADISVIMISQSSAEYSISFCVPRNDADKAVTALNIAFDLEIKSALLDPIQVQLDLAVITVVGDKMQHQRGIAARFFNALANARVNIIAIAQDSSERTISAVVRAKRLDDATRICHASLFKHVANIDVVVIGCGTVGKVLIDQILSQTDYLAQQNIALKLVGIANSRQLLLETNGIHPGDDWQSKLNQQDEGLSLDKLYTFVQEAHLINPVIIDCTSSLDIARDYVKYLEHGFHVVTANKKANTEDMSYYKALRTASVNGLKKFLYETNVGAGLPVIDNLQGLLKAGDQLLTFEGILSGSLSYIFGEVHNGLTLSEATAKARSMGYTEPNPAEDLSGLDVARKALVIAREAGLELEMSELEVVAAVPEQLANITDADDFMSKLSDYDAEFSQQVAEAEAAGKVLRYIARIEGCTIKVGIQAVDKDNPLYGVMGGENAMSIHTRFYDPVPIVIRGYGAGAEVTAAGLFGDMLKTMRVESSVVV